MEENLGSMVADVSRLIRRSFDERARGIGVTRPQWRVLSVLLRNEGINQGGLADRLEVEPITLCRMVDRLQDADLVERHPDPADRRAWRLYLTEKAHTLLEQMRPLAEGMFVDALDGLTVQEQAQMMSSLDRVRQNLSRKSQEPEVSRG
jgi:DNA-binding MarR family transcriptional regulator